MSSCEKCGVEVSREEALQVDGKLVCEDCLLKSHNPPKPCGGGKV